MSKTEEQKQRQREASRRWKERNPERTREIDLKSYYRHRDKNMAQMRAYRKEHREEYRQNSRQYYAKHRKDFAQRSREVRGKLKLETMTYYSLGDTPYCASCGITDIDVLCLDHINNDGAEHRKLAGRAGTVTYGWLKKRGYPDGFQVLCANCNLKKLITVRRGNV